MSVSPLFYLFKRSNGVYYILIDPSHPRPLCREMLRMYNPEDADDTLLSADTVQLTQQRPGSPSPLFT